LEFDGKEDYISIPDGVVPDTEKTISMWIYFDAYPPIGDDYLDGWTLLFWGPKIHCDPSSVILMLNSTGRIKIIAGCCGDYLNSQTVLTPNNWHHVVVVIDNSYAAKIYINGNPETILSSEYTCNQRIGTGDNALIGNMWRHGSFSDYFNGIIDEVNIYNRALTAAEIKANWDKLKPCTSGETKPCTAQNTCQGTQTCINEKWSDCTTTLKKCSDDSCKTTCICEYEGQTRSCTASNDCLGTQTCSNEQWSDCETNLQKCPDGSCISQSETCTCKEGDTRGCTAPNECYGKEKCIDGKWSDCTTDLKKNPDGSCTAPGEEGGNINPPHFSSKALDADDKNPGRIAVQVTNIMGNPNLDMQIIMDVPDNVEVSGSTNVLEGKSSYSTTIKGTGTRWIEIPFTAKNPGNYRISILIYWKWEGSPEPLRQVGFDHTVYVDKKQGEITEEQKEPDNAGNGKQGEFPTPTHLLLITIVFLGLAVIIAVWKKPKFIFRHKE